MIRNALIILAVLYIFHQFVWLPGIEKAVNEAKNCNCG